MDCGATTSFGSVQGAEAPFSKIHEHDTRIPDVDFLVVDHSILETVLRPRLHPCPDSQFEVMLLVILGSLCTCSQTNQNRLR